jgi:polyphosphate kinase
LLITRNEGGKHIDYVNIGTGNFNENTANLYCDHSLMTSNADITEEVAKVFHFYHNNFHIGTYKHLLVSPFTMRERLIKFIKKEIKSAKEGKEAYIILKLNSLVDQEVVEKLYDASRAGVKIKLIIRGSCSVMTGIKGVSENIEAISIIDKYLEHARILIFCNEGDERMYITSADWMYRNFDLRNEIAVPIYDKKIREDLKAMLNIQFNDNTKARILDAKQTNMYKFAAPGAKKVRAQNDIYNYLKNRLTNT